MLENTVPGLDRSLAEPPDPQPWPDEGWFFEDYEDDGYLAVRAYAKYASHGNYGGLKPTLDWTVATKARGIENGEFVLLIECRTPFNSDVAKAQPVAPVDEKPVCQHTADVNRFAGTVVGQGDYMKGTFFCPVCNKAYTHDIEQGAYHRLKTMCRKAILEGETHDRAKQEVCGS